ncbi:PKD domain-containing protein [Flavobacterium sp. LS1R47]|uniref:PKD domain-containing protein n=1 Tax=Flavobacterium frigoritolerans TaxID=2987686 RepID=A0A9X3C848_9FLAO|nr:PKD domain-containing protein [Flavobacterium frigoritolerans]MCV9932967.1 PKD domain-containing protein [Flavobacterium frigoritolerans]
MGKLYFLHLYFLLIITTSVHAFGAVNKNDFTSNKGYKNLVLVPNVDFNFTNDGTCSGTPITFTPIVSATAPFSYKWDFGDGTTSTDSNPSHSFTAVGCGTQSFVVKLTVTDASGENSITKTITVKQKPDLKFGNVNTPGSLKPFERCGDNNSDPKYSINVSNNSASSACITSYNVDWGDGSSETNVVFPKQHEYQKLGSFNMVITGIGNNGCNNSVTYVVKNSNNPLGALIAPGNTTNLCLPVAPMNFAIGAWGLNPSDTRYVVNYGDGTVQSYTQGQLESSSYYNAGNPQASQNFPVPHKFTRANCPSGNTVSLTITTSCGSTYLTAGPIIILGVPVISFKVNSIACVNTSIYFENTTVAGYTNDCSTYNVYTWDFGDGTTSREVNLYHVYTAPGKYTVKLNATTPCGAGIETTREICVEPILQPSFTFGNACASTNVQMTNTTDTRLTCGTESYYWEVTNYVEGFCGKESVPGTGRGQWNFANGTYSSSKDPVFNFTLPGTYYVRLRTMNSCDVYTYSATQAIQVKKPPVTTLKPISDFCNSATINPVGTVEETCSPSSEITYLWSFPGGTPSSSTLLNPGPINYTTSGNYVATFSVTNSCGTTTKTAPFSVDLVLSPVIKDKTVKICSGTSFQVTPVTNGIDNVPAGTTYVWSTPVVSPAGAVSGANAQSSPRSNISQTLINNTANPATVTYTVSPISTACPGPNFTITVTVDPLIKVTQVTKNGTCFGSNDGSITISVTGGIPFATATPYTFLWTGPNGFTSTDKDISNLKPGTYYLSVKDNGNCPFSQAYSVSEPGKFQTSGGKNDITCFGLNNGSINLYTTGGTQPYTYVWTKDGNPYAATTGNINNLGPGKYDVTITEVNNCDILTDRYTIIEPPLLKVKWESQVDILCYGYYTGEINVSTIGGRYTELSPGVFNYRYSWTGPNGFRSNLQNLKNLAAGTYNLTVTDNSGCEDKLSVVLLQNDEIRLNYSKTEIACYNYANASITINSITGGVPFTTGDPYIIEWSNLGTGLVQNNLSAGTYVITITDALGCPKVFPIVIDNAPVFTINPDVKNVSCFGANDGHIRLNLIGGKAPVKLVWDDNSTAGIERNNIGPGKYSVTITDGKACVIRETFIIIEPLLLELRADVSNPLDCVDANTGEINLVVTGGLPPFTYSWSNGAKTEDLSKLPPGTYAVTVTDANGCKKSEEWKITRFDQLTPTIEVLTDFDCETKYVHQTFVGHVKGGIPPYTLSWSDGVVSGPNNEIMNTENKGLIIFSVTDSFGCTADFPYNVNTPVLGIANYSTSSYGKDVYDLYSIYDPILFTNLATGDFTNISWDFGDGKFSNEENPKHIYTREGTYTIKQTVTYPFGCQYSYTSTLVVEKGYSLIMPNAFTPNNDGYNDTFAPVFLGFDSITLDVYDTWGGIVYSETGKNISGWNGQIKNHAAENGNYFFKITAKTFYNHTITERGAFTLLK